MSAHRLAGPIRGSREGSRRDAGEGLVRVDAGLSRGVDVAGPGAEPVAVDFRPQLAQRIALLDERKRWEVP